MKEKVITWHIYATMVSIDDIEWNIFYYINFVKYYGYYSRPFELLEGEINVIEEMSYDIINYIREKI